MRDGSAGEAEDGVKLLGEVRTDGERRRQEESRKSGPLRGGLTSPLAAVCRGSHIISFMTSLSGAVHASVACPPSPVCCLRSAAECVKWCFIKAAAPDKPLLHGVRSTELQTTSLEQEHPPSEQTSEHGSQQSQLLYFWAGFRYFTGRLPLPVSRLLD